MGKLSWTKIFEVNGRMNAELIQSCFEAYGIDTEIFYEAIDLYRTGNMFGRVQIFVPIALLDKAWMVYEESGWNMAITDAADDDEE